MHLDPFELFVSYAVLVFAISVHEAAHAWTASRYGDPTARMLGRITLNPIYHIDPIGTFALPVIAMISGMPLIGWGKPTPVNPLNFGRNHVRADIMTSVAGPISNLVVATASVLVLAIVTRAQLMLGGAAEPLFRLFVAALEINVLLAVFNIIPVPPLDGSHVLRHALSGRSLELYDRIGVFGLLLLFVVGRSIIRTLEAPFMAFFARLLVAIS
ncbi:MAG TPA: site-2 protease family protein [Terriglobales bacterium]|jgi:Zn-dependent protease|nr:site-2 protease family protein [Terriglobales bacterium]